ncbi:MAG: contractile injection system protein, VgrG/Pvc8 family [Rhodospirillales bacterium]|nr:contractile injection system protein, VgrG/Pvc8 family [Rhodospirillales bacterium]
MSGTLPLPPALPLPLPPTPPAGGAASAATAPWQPPVGATTSLAVPQWQVVYNGTDISGDILPMVTQVSYQENVGGLTATMAVNVEDTLYRFQRSSYPQQGDTIQLSIGYAGAALVPCGSFDIDSFEVAGPPDTFTMHGIQAGIRNGLRTRRNIAYENMTVPEIAQAVAARDGMTAVITPTSPNVVYKRVTQHMETDLYFLHRLANLHNYEFTIRGNQLVFYGRATLESQAPADTIARAQVIRFAFSNQSLAHLSYASALVTYQNPSAKALQSGKATNPAAASTDQLRLAHRLEQNQQGALRAQSALWEANMEQATATLTMPGTMLYRAGNTVNVKGFGVWDTIKYLVKSARHELAPTGYATYLSLRNVVAGSAASEKVALPLQKVQAP